MYAIVDLCILCLKNNENLKSILSQDKDGMLVEDKLRFLIEFVNIDPDISKHICMHCLESLNYVCNFKQSCLRNITKLNNYIHALKSAKEPHRNIRVTQTDLEESQVKIENLDNSEPRIEHLNLDNFILKRDPSDDATEIEYILPDKDNEELAKKDDIVVKIETDDNSDNEDNKAQENVIKENATANEYDILTCETGDEVLKEENGDSRNEFSIKSDRGNDSEDKLQNETANNADYLSTSNTSSSSTDKETHKCNKCQISFRNRFELLRHTGPHASFESYKCDFCDRTFNRRANLIKHKCAVTALPYKCDKCDATFGYESHLIIHNRRHTRHKCDVCDKAFNFKINLVEHKRTHTGEKPYVCDVCGKAFSRGTTLRYHRRVHTGEKPYKCDRCDKAFSRTHHLSNHKCSSNSR